MKRLGTLDASWLAVESEDTPMHVGTLQIFSLPEGAPETFLIDKNGIIRHKYVGAIDERVWREQLAALYQELVDE